MTDGRHELSHFVTRDVFLSFFCHVLSRVTEFSFFLFNRRHVSSRLKKGSDHGRFGEFLKGLFFSLQSNAPGFCRTEKKRRYRLVLIFRGSIGEPYGVPCGNARIDKIEEIPVFPLLPFGISHIYVFYIANVFWLLPGLPQIS